MTKRTHEPGVMDRLLHVAQKTLCAAENQLALSLEALDVAENQLHALRRIESYLSPPHPNHIFISEGEHMPQDPLIGLAPGASEQLTAHAADSSGAFGDFPNGEVPTWSSDNSKVTVTANDATGLTATVTVADDATPGETANITATTGSGLSSGPVPFPTLEPTGPPPPPPPPPFQAVSIVITQGSTDTGAGTGTDTGAGTGTDTGGTATEPGTDPGATQPGGVIEGGATLTPNTEAVALPKANLTPNQILAGVR